MKISFLKSDNKKYLFRLDSLLESGLKCGKIYELSGMSCSGKSTLS